MSVPDLKAIREYLATVDRDPQRYLEFECGEFWAVEHCQVDALLDYTEALQDEVNIQREISAVTAQRLRVERDRAIAVGESLLSGGGEKP